MSENINDEFDWGLLDLLDPIQLGMLYESLIKNASCVGMNSRQAKAYMKWAEGVKRGIESNCGFEDYVKFHQKECRQLADYDNRMGWRG